MLAKCHEDNCRSISQLAHELGQARDAERLVRMQLASCSLRHCRKITTMTTERRIMMDAPDYWFRFERGLLAPEEKPTPSEAAAYIAYLRADIADLKRELEAAKRKKQMVKEGFAEFCDEVTRLARKHLPSA